jgi:hypothetical protein
MTDSLTHHFARSLFHSQKDGTTGHEMIDVYLDPKTLLFSVNMPEYIAKSPVEGAAEKLTGVAFGDLASQYEKLNESYSRWKLMAQASPMLLIDVVSVPPDEGEMSCIVSYSVRECFVTKDGRHISIQGNPWINVATITGTLVPHIMEIRNKLSAMMDSFNLAAGIVAEISKTDDPTDYIIKLEVPWAQGSNINKTKPAESVDGGGDLVKHATIDNDEEL